jgi:hypothetical protein
MSYRKDPEVLEGLVNEFEQLPPEYKGMRVETTCIGRVGGVQGSSAEGDRVLGRHERIVVARVIKAPTVSMSSALCSSTQPLNVRH